MVLFVEMIASTAVSTRSIRAPCSAIVVWAVAEFVAAAATAARNTSAVTDILCVKCEMRNAKCEVLQLVVVDAAARRLRDRSFTCARVLASLSVSLRRRHTCRYSARCISGLDQG